MSIGKLHPFENQPYKVLDNEDMDALVESIKENGVLTPILVRGLENGEYEVISGHRRLHACEKAGITKVPVMIKDMDRDEAAIQLVDSNLHREHILPSEKAFAYKMKYDALKHQGKTSDQVGPKLSTEIISDVDSSSQVKRYIRLTNLIPELLDLVDKERMALTPAVELSYLSEHEQKELLTTIESEDRTPSLSQAQRLKVLSQNGKLDNESIFSIMTEIKSNEVQKVTLKYEELKKYFPREYTAREIQKEIMKLVENEYSRKHRLRGERDER